MEKRSPDPAGPCTTGATARPWSAAGAGPRSPPAAFVLGVRGTPSPTTTPAVPLTLASTAMGTECPAAKLSSGTCAGSALGLSPAVVAAAAAAAAAARAQPNPLAPGAAETEAGEARASRAAAAVPIATGAGPRQGAEAAQGAAQGCDPAPGSRSPHPCPTERRQSGPHPSQSHKLPRYRHPDLSSCTPILQDRPLTQTPFEGFSMPPNIAHMGAQAPQGLGTPTLRDLHQVTKSSLAFLSLHQTGGVLTRQGTPFGAAVPSVTLTKALP